MREITANDLELGQIMYGNPVGEYTCPEFVEALIKYVLDEIERIFWNENQREWDHIEDPKISNIKYNTYYWGEDEEQASSPNFSYDGVELRWYKHFGRSMTLNCEKSIEDWIKWFDKCLVEVRSNDSVLNALKEQQ